MDHKFYDVKAKKAVTTAVTEGKIYGAKSNPRYAVCGKTKDGRSLTCFISKADFEAFQKKGVKFAKAAKK